MLFDPYENELIVFLNDWVWDRKNYGDNKIANCGTIKDIRKCKRQSPSWFPYNRNGIGGSVQDRVRLRYLRLVPGTAGRVQSCLRYRWSIQSEKRNFMSPVCWNGVLHISLSKWLQESKKQAIFANVFFLVIEDSTEEEIKSKVNTDFGSVKYFDNVNKMNNSPDCLLNWDFVTENTVTGSRQGNISS